MEGRRPVPTATETWLDDNNSRHPRNVQAPSALFGQKTSPAGQFTVPAAIPYPHADCRQMRMPADQDESPKSPFEGVFNAPLRPSRHATSAVPGVPAATPATQGDSSRWSSTGEQRPQEWAPGSPHVDPCQFTGSSVKREPPVAMEPPVETPRARAGHGPLLTILRSDSSRAENAASCSSDIERKFAEIVQRNARHPVTTPKCAESSTTSTQGFELKFAEVVDRKLETPRTPGPSAPTPQPSSSQWSPPAALLQPPTHEGESNTANRMQAASPGAKRRILAEEIRELARVRSIQSMQEPPASDTQVPPTPRASRLVSAPEAAIARITGRTYGSVQLPIGGTPSPTSKDSREWQFSAASGGSVVEVPPPGPAGPRQQAAAIAQQALDKQSDKRTPPQSANKNNLSVIEETLTTAGPRSSNVPLRSELYKESSTRSVEEIKLVGELEHMELTLLREMRRSDTLEAEFQACLATEREEHARAIARLEQLVHQAHADNKGLALRVAELEAAQKFTPPLLSVGPPPGVSSTPSGDDASASTGSSSGARQRGATTGPFVRRRPPSQYMLSPRSRHSRSSGASGGSGENTLSGEGSGGVPGSPLVAPGGSTTASPGGSAMSDSGGSTGDHPSGEEEGFSAFMKQAALRSLSLPSTRDVADEVSCKDVQSPSLPSTLPSVKSGGSSSLYMLPGNAVGHGTPHGGGTGDLQKNYTPPAWWPGSSGSGTYRVPDSGGTDLSW